MPTFHNGRSRATMTALLAGAFCSGATQISDADVLSSFYFNSNNTTQTVAVVPMSITSPDGIFYYPQLTVTGTDGLAVYSNTGPRTILISGDLSGYTDIVGTFVTLRTSLGFTSEQWSYSTDGMTYTPWGDPLTLTTTGKTVMLPTLTGVQFSTTTTFKITVTDPLANATRFDGADFDSVAFLGYEVGPDHPITVTAVPLPGSLSLAAAGCAGVAAVMTLRRRREVAL